MRLPPLRERREDVTELLRVFLGQLGGGSIPTLHPRFVEAVLVHAFPDNVRGLWQLARQLVCVHGHEPELRRSHLPVEFLGSSGSGATYIPSLPPAEVPVPVPRGSQRPPPRVATEGDWPALLEALKATNGNVAQAAGLVGLSRHQAYRLMRGQGFTDLENLRR